MQISKKLSWLNVGKFAGHITFLSDVAVSGDQGITMDIEATINDFDPSLHASLSHDFQDVISHEVNFEDYLLV